MIYIDLNRVGHDLEGEIKISCVFLPRFDLTEKLDVFSRLRLEMLSDEPSLDKKEDAFKAMIPPVSSLSLRNQVCYIQLQRMQLLNFDKVLANKHKHIQLEVSYGTFRQVSTCTIDPAKTQFKELYDQFFRINLTDLNQKVQDEANFTIYQDRSILIQAFSLGSNFAEQRELIGETKLNSGFLR